MKKNIVFDKTSFFYIFRLNAGKSNLKSFVQFYFIFYIKFYHTKHIVKGWLFVNKGIENFFSINDERYWQLQWMWSYNILCFNCKHKSLKTIIVCIFCHKQLFKILYCQAQLWTQPNLSWELIIAFFKKSRQPPTHMWRHSLSHTTSLRLIIVLYFWGKINLGYEPNTSRRLKLVWFSLNPVSQPPTHPWK